MPALTIVAGVPAIVGAPLLLDEEPEPDPEPEFEDPEFEDPEFEEPEFEEPEFDEPEFEDPEFDEPDPPDEPEFEFVEPPPVPGNTVPGRGLTMGPDRVPGLGPFCVGNVRPLLRFGSAPKLLVPVAPVLPPPTANGVDDPLAARSLEVPLPPQPLSAPALINKPLTVKTRQSALALIVRLPEPFQTPQHAAQADVSGEHRTRTGKLLGELDRQETDSALTRALRSVMERSRQPRCHRLWSR